MKHFLVLAASLLTTVLTTTISGSAFAQSTTEYFHMPAAGVFDITPHVGFRTSTSRTKSAGSLDYNWSGLDRLGAKAMYGVNPLVAVGADLSYSSYKITNNGGDANGIEPLQVFVDGQLPMAMGNLQYGLRVSFGLEKAQTTAGKANRSFGDAWDGVVQSAFSVAPYLGYAFRAGEVGSFGGRLSYQVINSDTKYEDPNTGQSATASGGAQGNAALFYETKAADVSLGAALTYDWFNKTTADAGAGTFDLIAARSLIGVKLYSDLPFGPNVSFLPSLSWREKAASDDFDKLSDIRFSVAGRFSF
jgi:hypothetical protein